MSIIFLLIFSTGVSCSSLEIFKNEVRTEFNLTDSELNYIQYYVGGAVQLQYRNLEARSNLSENNSVERDLTQYDKIITISNETPGVLERIDNNVLHISVGDDIILGFEPNGESPQSSYLLRFINGQLVSDRTVVNINNEEFLVIFGEEASNITRNFTPINKRPVLKYQFSERLRKIKEERRVRGRTLD